MRFFGVLVVAAAVGFATDIILQNTNQLDVDVLGRTFTVAAGWLVVVGVVVAFVAAIGLWFIGKGFARARVRRAASRATARERDELARALAAERADRQRTEERAASNAPIPQSDVSAPDSAGDRAEMPSSASD